MCKNLKIKFIITIIAIMFLALVIPSITNKSLAVQMSDSEKVKGFYNSADINNATSYTISNSKDLDGLINKTDVHIGGQLFKNDFVFCIQRGENISFKDSLSRTCVGESFEIKGDTARVLNGLAYILSYESDDYERTSCEYDTDDSPDWVWYQDDPVQLALWKYLDVHNDSINSNLGFVESSINGTPNKHFPSQVSDEIQIGYDNNGTRVYLWC